MWEGVRFGGLPFSFSPVLTVSPVESTPLKIASERTQIEFDDLWVIQQISTGPRVCIRALVENVTTIADTECFVGVLFNDQDAHPGRRDPSNAVEHVVLHDRRQAS